MSEAPRESRKAFWAKCGACGHCWAACWLPMELATAARLLGRAACPACGSGNALVAKQDDGRLLESEGT